MEPHLDDRNSQSTCRTICKGTIFDTCVQFSVQNFNPVFCVDSYSNTNLHTTAKIEPVVWVVHFTYRSSFFALRMANNCYTPLFSIKSQSSVWRVRDLLLTQSQNLSTISVHLSPFGKCFRLFIYILFCLEAGH